MNEITRKFVATAAVAVALGASAFVQAVPIGPAEYFHPYEFLEVAGSPDGLATAFAATVLIPGKASGVLISSDGLVLTAAHVISDLYIGATEHCPKLAIYLNHEIGSDGAAVPGLLRMPCERILVWDYANDYSLFKVKVPPGKRLPFARIEKNPDAIRVGARIIVAGHPNAGNFSLGQKKISIGEIALYEPNHTELPHFLHLADTDGGSSGGPVFDERGMLLGVHFRGVPYFSNGVPAWVSGNPTVLRTFNVALPLPDLYAKFGHLIED